MAAQLIVLDSTCRCIKCAVTIRDTALRITCLRAALGRTMFGISAREDDMDIIETEEAVINYTEAA